MRIDRDRLDAARILLNGLLREARAAGQAEVEDLLTQAEFNLREAQVLIEGYGLFMQVPHGYVPPVIPRHASSSPHWLSPMDIEPHPNADTPDKMED